MEHTNEGWGFSEWRNAVRSTAEGEHIIFLLGLHSSDFTLGYFYEGRLSFFLSFFLSPGFLGLLLVFTGCEVRNLGE